MKFLIFRDFCIYFFEFFRIFNKFFGIFLNFFELKIDFISAQVTWHNLYHSIKSRSTIKTRGDMAACGASDRAIKLRSSIDT